MSSTAPEAMSFEQREAEKAASRAEDVRALSSGEKTRAQLAKENMPFKLSGKRIDYSASKSDLW